MAAAADVAARIEAALADIDGDVARTGNRADRVYFDEHTARFRDTAQRIVELVPRGGRILDFGGHFLHQAALLSRLGYAVVASDVPDFAAVPFIRARADAFGIRLQTVAFDDVAAGRYLDDVHRTFDAFLFCEVLEHITFNPIAFWRRVRDLVRPGGIIYITTPNALKLLSVLGALRGLVTLRRIGISVDAIFAHVTYGHHWKEYSAREVRQYFARMSDDFTVSVRQCAFAPDRVFPRTAVGNAKEMVRRVGNASGVFADQLEAVVRVDGHTPWHLEPPTPT